MDGDLEVSANDAADTAEIVRTWLIEQELVSLTACREARYKHLLSPISDALLSKVAAITGHRYRIVHEHI